MKLAYIFLNIVSKLAIFIVLFCILFLLQKYTIGYLLGIRNIVLFNKIYLYELLFTASSLFIILKYTKFISPYDKRLSKC